MKLLASLRSGPIGVFRRSPAAAVVTALALGYLVGRIGRLVRR